IFRYECTQAQTDTLLNGILKWASQNGTNLLAACTVYAEHLQNIERASASYEYLVNLKPCFVQKLLSIKFVQATQFERLVSGGVQEFSNVMSDAKLTN